MNKAETVTQIKAIDPSIECNVDDFTHAELTELFEKAVDVQREANEAKASDAPDAPAEPDEPDEDEEDEGRKPGLYVCAGKSITSPKGLLNEGSGPHDAKLFGDVKRLKKLGCLEVVK